MTNIKTITSTYRFVPFPGFLGGPPGVPRVPWGPFPEGPRKSEEVRGKFETVGESLRKFENVIKSRSRVL